ncbi:MAG: hypothetical protein AAB449_01385 [Patescibacteria group bacterium]
MKKISQEEQELLEQITLTDFLDSYNKNMPERFPRVTTVILKKFKEAHPSFFKHGDLWSLNLHRKKIMDWLPLNGDPV